LSNEYYVIFKTKSGWIGLSGSPKGLSRTTLPQASEDAAASLLGEDAGSRVFDSAFFESLISKFQAYFEGQKVDFPEKIDLSETTPFQRKVWEATRSIPYGQTRSYSWVADQILRPQSSRAVGQALGRNPLPIVVPCHRVLAADGSLCGFAGGILMKQFLLRMEKIIVPEKPAVRNPY
jgi:methylated-DNA-[protein]-cysteine S-methyltransferase